MRHPETGKWQEWRAYHDRQSSQALEVEIIKQLERGEVGLVDPTAVHRRTTLDDHLQAFEGYLEDKNNTPGHIDKTLARCRRLLKQMNAQTVTQITAQGVDAGLASFRRAGMSLSTSNGYFRAIRSFCRWLVHSKRIRENPLLGMNCRRVTDADRQRQRRNLSDTELQALIHVARRSSRTFMGLTGSDRALLYLVAVNTGLRASELASLTPESFEFEQGQPVVRCQPGYTKNGEEASYPCEATSYACSATGCHPNEWINPFGRAIGPNDAGALR